MNESTAHDNETALKLLNGNNKVQLLTVAVTVSLSANRIRYKINQNLTKLSKETTNKLE